MWHMLEKITEQVTKYSTFWGQLWYILVFVFRLIVVVTIGGSVYGDEQAAFKCSTDVVGCQNICYNEFAKISHLRFWAFQLLAVATPTVFFHFYTLYVSGEIQKLKHAEVKLKAIEEGESGPLLEYDEKNFRAMSRRKKSIGNIKTRQIYSGNELKEVVYTNKIHYAYYLNIVVRMILEGVFIYFGYVLFMNMDQDCKYHPEDHFCPQSGNPFYFLWMKVPASYLCRGKQGSDVWTACTMHVRQGGFVPCFVSRPYEKTVFLCYMSILSAICFLISALELVVVTMRRVLRNNKPKKSLFRHPLTSRPRNESVFYGPAPTAPENYRERNGGVYPSLGIPISFGNRYEQPEKHVSHKGREAHSSGDEDKKEEKENFSDA